MSFLAKCDRCGATERYEPSKHGSRPDGWGSVTPYVHKVGESPKEFAAKKRRKCLLCPGCIQELLQWLKETRHIARPNKIGL